MTPTPEMIERAARAIYTATGFELRDPWDEAKLRQERIIPGSFSPEQWKAIVAARTALELAFSEDFQRPKHSPLAETPSAPSKPGEWKTIFERFDKAACDRFDKATLPWGWQIVNVEYDTARTAMLECLTSLERERDEARYERDNPDYTTEDYHRLHRAHCAVEDARRKAVEERDILLKALTPFGEAARDPFNIWKPDNSSALISVGDLRAAAIAISALDPKGDQP